MTGLLTTLFQQECAAFFNSAHTQDLRVTRGNIFYGPDEANNADFTVRLTDGLTLSYNHEAPGDDFYISPDDPEQTSHYGAVWITPGESDHTGDISVFSSAKINSNAGGIVAAHFGESGALRLELMGGDITTTGEDASGFYGLHEGEGDIEILARNSVVMTMGEDSSGIVGSHRGTGTVDIDAHNVTIATDAMGADGIYGFHGDGEGDILISAKGGVITTKGAGAEAVLAIHTGSGEIGIDVRDADIRAEGEGSEAIHGLHRSEGDVNIITRNSFVTTMGLQAFGVRGSHAGMGTIDIHVRDVIVTTENRNADGIYGIHVGAEGDIRISAEGGAITTKGVGAEGILATHNRTGEIDIDVHGVNIMTEGNGSEGIHGLHQREGGVSIRARDVNVTTMGVEAFGIRGSHGPGPGEIDIDVRDTTIITTSENAHGVLGYHAGPGPIRIAVDGGDIRTAGVDASGVQVGRLSPRGAVSFAAEVGEDGYRKQSVTVNGRVFGGSSAGAGIFLAGGGRLTIGPKGSLGAESGTAIRAAGETPKLYIDMNLDGRRAAEVIGDNRILNDGGGNHTPDQRSEAARRRDRRNRRRGSERDMGRHS